MTNCDRDPDALAHPWALTDAEHHLLLSLAITTVAKQTGCDEQTAADVLDELPTNVRSVDGFNYQLLANGHPLVHAQRDWLASTVGIAQGDGVPDDLAGLDEPSPADPHDDQRRLLDEFIVEAIKDQKPEDQLHIATLVDAGLYDVMTEFDLDDAGQPDPHALWYRVDLHQADGARVGLVRVHYSRLGLTDDDAAMELQATLAQHGLGVPDDLSGLDEQ